MPGLVRLLAPLVLCVACAADDPTGLFAGERAATTDTPVVETETLEVDLDALETATTDPEPAAPAPVEIPEDALDWTAFATVDIDIQDNAFTQRTVVVRVGTRITWTNQGRNEHNVRPAIEGAFEPIAAAALAAKGDAASLVFDSAGDFPYFCSLHGTARNGQTGRVIVVP